MELGSNYKQSSKDRSQDNPVALVLNSKVSGLGVIRSLGVKGISVLALDSEPLPIGMYSRYVKRRVICPDPLHQEEAFVDLLISIGKEMDVPGILFPTTDDYVIAVVRSRAELEKYYQIPFSHWDVIKEIVDKEHQYKKAMKAGIPIPKSYFPKDYQETKQIGKEIGYPVILKPAYSHPFVIKYKIKAVKVNSYKELIEKYQKYTSAGHKMIIQEIIEGNADRLYEFVSYTNSKREPTAIFVGRKLEQYPPDFGSGTVFESVDEPRIVELGTRLLKVFNYHGISFSEFKLDPRDDQFKLMEFNPRITHCNSLSTECGVNLAHIAYQDARGYNQGTIIFPDRYGIKWVYPEMRLLKRKKIIHYGKYGLPRPKKLVYAIFSFDDPMPEIFFFIGSLYRRVKRELGILRTDKDCSGVSGFKQCLFK